MQTPVAGTGEDRCVLDCIASLRNGADLLWIETEKPHIEQIAGMVDRIRAVTGTVTASPRGDSTRQTSLPCTLL